MQDDELEQLHLDEMLAEAAMEEAELQQEQAERIRDSLREDGESV